MIRLFSIPRKRFRPDYGAYRKITEVTDQGGVIGLFPEGERSWTVETLNFKPKVLKLLLRKPAIPVLPVKIQGNYHAWPRWSGGMRRYRITVEFREPFLTGPRLTPEALEKEIIQSLGEYSAPEKISKGPADPASDIGKVFYRCHSCREFNSFRTQTDFIKCVKCGSELKLTDNLNVNFT